MLKTLKETLIRHGFHAEVCETSEQAKNAVLSIIGTKSVGIGGSKTVRQLGLAEALEANGNTVHWHWLKDKSEKHETQVAAMNAETYLCSSNAILEDGTLVNIDGTGNRVASLLFGPACAIVVIGKNKICKDLNSAIARIKRDACPENARRQNLKTPCAATGECHDCTTSARMCNATVLIERPLRIHKEFHVILVDEELGL